jgi:serine/threonine protein phosphatase PrpC
LNAMGAGADVAANHPMRHVLTNGIGMGAELSPAVAEERLASGERWLICTDGVHGYLDRHALRGAMAATSPKVAAMEVVGRAVRVGTTDNATAVVLNVD